MNDKIKNHLIDHVSQFLLQLIWVELLHLAVLHLLLSANRLSFFNFVCVLFLHWFFELMLAVALLTDIEVALFAVMQIDGLFSAKVALSFSLKLCQFEGVFVVASLKGYWSAFAAVAFSILVAEHAYQFYAFLLLAYHTDIVVILRSCPVSEDMAFFAFESDRSLFVRGHSSAVIEAIGAKLCLAASIIIKFLQVDPTAHAVIAFLNSFFQFNLLKLMVKVAGVIKIDVDYFAAETVSLVTVGAIFWTASIFSAQCASR